MKTAKYLNFRHTAVFNVMCIVCLNSTMPRYGVQNSLWCEQGADSRDTAGNTSMPEVLPCGVSALLGVSTSTYL